MILPESRPFAWNEDEWRKHIESVVFALGVYENDKRRIRRTGLRRLVWAVDHRDGGQWWSPKLYESLDDAISDFMSLEVLPPLDAPQDRIGCPQVLPASESRTNPDECRDPSEGSRGRQGEQ
jgi:hypothetical protein